jgi:hypothetical protein
MPAGRAAQPERVPPPEFEDDYDFFEEMADAPPASRSQPADTGLSFAKDRLLEAFPGAEEVKGT